MLYLVGYILSSSTVGLGCLPYAYTMNVPNVIFTITVVIITFYGGLLYYIWLAVFHIHPQGDFELAHVCTS